MEIIDKRESKKVEFNEITIGTVFYYDGRVYIKSVVKPDIGRGYTNAFSLDKSEPVCFFKTTYVEPIEKAVLILS